MNEIDVLLAILEQHILFEIRHPGYYRAAEVARFAKMIATGEGQEDIIRDIRRSEDEDMKADRVRLTNSLTKYAISRPRKYWKKISRVEGINRKIESSDKDKLERLKIQFGKFANGRDLEQWLNWKLEVMNVTDPNAWIIYERKDSRDIEGGIIETKIYPWEVHSSMVINYKYEFDEIRWLIVRDIELEYGTDGSAKTEKVLEKYWMYFPGGIIRMREAGEFVKAQDGEVVRILMPVTDSGEERKFFLKVIDNGTTEVPAMMVGAYEDEKHAGGFVPWFDPAEQVFKDLIRDKSFLDVTKVKHVYAKRWEYVRPCRFEDKEHGACQQGFLSGNPQWRCPACGGTGSPDTFASEQMVNKLALPTKGSTADLLELSKLHHTEDFPIDLPKWLQEQVEKDEERIMQAVFSKGLVSGATGSAEKTATQTNYEYEDIYDVLAPFADLNSRHFELAYRIGAQYLEMRDIIVDHRYPKDFKLKSMGDLIAEYQDAKTAGVGYETLWVIQEQIIAKSHEDDPSEVDRIMARYLWLPFPDKTDTELAQILADRSPLDSQRVLRENWSEIFNEIEEQYKNPQFHALEYNMQKGIVEAKVTDWSGRISLAFPDDSQG